METPKFTNSQIANIGLVAGLCLWAFFALGGLLTVSGSSNASCGDWGDIFGAFSALVSVVGIWAILKQLQQQEVDGKETEERHKELIDNQQKLFAADVKIRLFQKRVDLYRAVMREAQHWCATPFSKSPAFDEDLVASFSFIYPRDSPFAKQTFEVVKSISTIRNLITHNAHSEFVKNLALEEQLKQEQKGLIANVEQLTEYAHEYLNLTTIDKL